MSNLYPNLCGVNYESLVDGEGVRTVLFFSGCPHHCPGCQNPDSWSPTAGDNVTDMLIQQIADEIGKRPFVRGITLSGGDPFYCPRQTWRFFKDLREAVSQYRPDIRGKSTNPCDDLWIYTGYTIEELWDKTWEDQADRDAVVLLLTTARILVDGRFEESLANRKLRYRGSSNQRLIDMGETLGRSEEKMKLDVALYRRHDTTKKGRKA